jgi:hypothetical protein
MRAGVTGWGIPIYLGYYDYHVCGESPATQTTLTSLAPFTDIKYKNLKEKKTFSKLFKCMALNSF